MSITATGIAIDQNGLYRESVGPIHEDGLYGKFGESVALSEFVATTGYGKRAHTWNRSYLSGVCLPCLSHVLSLPVI